MAKCSESYPTTVSALDIGALQNSSQNFRGVTVVDRSDAR